MDDRDEFRQMGDGDGSGIMDDSDVCKLRADYNESELIAMVTGQV